MSSSATHLAGLPERSGITSVPRPLSSLTPMPRPMSERRLVFLIGAVQFINVLDFMMVMPLGPDFAVALGIPSSQLGLVGGSYTASAAVAGLAGAFFLDRFDRRRALAFSLAGLVLATPGRAASPPGSAPCWPPASSPARSAARPPPSRSPSSATRYRPTGAAARWGR